MVMEDDRRMSLSSAGRISGRQLFWLLFTLLGAPLIAALAVIGWDFLDTQRICTFIDANGGFTKLYPGSVTIGDAFGSGDSVDGRPLFRYQIVMVSIGFNSHGDHVDFSQPVKPGAQHPLAVLARLPNLAEVWVS